MKFIPIIGLVILAFTSCKKTVTQVQPPVNQAFSATYSLTTASWTTSDNNLSFFTNLNVPELDATIVQSGGVLVYLSFDNGSTFEAIPEVFNGIAYGAVHIRQSITIDLHAVDGSAITAPTGTILAKVILINAEPL
jgi:hypothetical protein